MSYYKNTGNIICKCGEHEFSLDPNYVEYGDFHDGLLLVYDKNGQYHYLDMDGNCVINLPFDFIGRDFNKGCAKVHHRRSDHVGKINHLGHYILTYQGDDYEISDDSPYFVSDGINGVSCACYEDGWKFIDYEGNILSQQYYSFISEPRRGYYILKKGGLMGLADSQGNEIIPCVMSWDSIQFFDFYAIIGNSFILDLKGNIIIKNGHEDVYVPCLYESIQNFMQGYAIVKRNRLQGLIDLSLNEVVLLRFS